MKKQILVDPSQAIAAAEARARAAGRTNDEKTFGATAEQKR